MAQKSHRVSREEVETVADRYVSRDGKRPSRKGAPRGKASKARTGLKPGPAKVTSASRRKVGRPDSATLVQLQADRAQAAAAARVGSSMEMRQAAFLDVIRMGWSFAKACDDTGVSRTTAYRWREDDSEGGFKERYEDALVEAKERLVDIVLKRATQDDEETGRQASDVLLMFATKAKLPEYRDNYRPEVAVNVNVGVSLAAFEEAAQMIRARYIEAERNRLQKAIDAGHVGPLPIIDLTPEAVTISQAASPAKPAPTSDVGEQDEHVKRRDEYDAIRRQARGEALDVAEGV